MHSVGRPIDRTRGPAIMSHHRPRPEPAFLTRRELLGRGGMGFGLIGLAGLMAERGAPPARSAGAGAIDLRPLAPRAPHFAPRARRVVHLFMNGGPSHVDT